VASFISSSGWGGHTLVEVWTGADWVVVDPTLVGLVGTIRPNSATELRRGQTRFVCLTRMAASDRIPIHYWSQSRAGNLYIQNRGFTRGPDPGFRSGLFEEIVQVGMYGWRFSTVLLLCELHL